MFSFHNHIVFSPLVKETLGVPAPVKVAAFLRRIIWLLRTGLGWHVSGSRGARTCQTQTQEMLIRKCFAWFYWKFLVALSRTG